MAGERGDGGGGVRADGSTDAVGAEPTTAETVRSVLAPVSADDCRAVFDGEERTRTTDDGDYEIRLEPVTDEGEVTAGMVVVTPA